MKAFSIWSFKLRRAWSDALFWLAHKWKTSFYLYLAVLFSCIIVVDAMSFRFASDMRQATFDLMVRYRLVVPPPDPDIVIVDINEASLAAMSGEYGRWPWPRQVLGEFVEQIQAQKPKAIVFDILYSDPDVFNPDSDAYFNEVIAGTNNTYFPMLRLDPSDDGKSQLTAKMIPRLEPMVDAQQAATFAMVMPFFQSVMDSGRVGLHNIYPDSDGIARTYTLYRNDHGWKIPSLPLTLAKDLGYATPETQQALLNWRGKPFTYHTVSFSDVYFDLSSKDKKRPRNEFTNKIVIIGSTAPSLFDIKATPVSKNFPGVEILATAIDNIKHDDFLKIPDGKTIYTGLTLLLIWATAWAFYRNIGRDKIDTFFGLSQFILIAISYASINFTTVYINLTGPVTFALIYFTFARMYAIGTSSALETSNVRAARERTGELFGVLMLVRLAPQEDIGNTSLLNDSTRETIRLAVERSGTNEKSVEIIKGAQKGLWKLFSDQLAISWLIERKEDNLRQSIQQEIETIRQMLPALLQKHHLWEGKELVWYVHEGAIAGGDAACDSWRTLYAEALLQWDESVRVTDECKT